MLSAAVESVRIYPAYKYAAKVNRDGRLAMLERGARQYLAQSRKGWVGCKTISEPGRAAHKMLMPVETVTFDILPPEPLSCYGSD
jgi:hypothetical protein